MIMAMAKTVAWLDFKTNYNLSKNLLNQFN